MSCPHRLSHVTKSFRGSIPPHSADNAGLEPTPECEPHGVARSHSLPGWHGATTCWDGWLGFVLFKRVKNMLFFRRIWRVGGGGPASPPWFRLCFTGWLQCGRGSSPPAVVAAKGKGFSGSTFFFFFYVIF